MWVIYDKKNQAVAAIHNGWRGSVQNIVGKTVERMVVAFGSEPHDLVAGVGPSLGPCCSEFIHHSQELPDSFRSFQVQKNYFDFWQISKSQLMKAGLQPDKIKMTKICTACSPDFFSYRRAKKRKGNGVTGRNCSIIALRKKAEVI